MTGRVRDMILDPEQTGGLTTVITEGAYYGMQTFDQALYDHVVAGRVTVEDALLAAIEPARLQAAARRAGPPRHDDGRRARRRRRAAAPPPDEGARAAPSSARPGPAGRRLHGAACARGRERSSPRDGSVDAASIAARRVLRSRYPAALQLVKCRRCRPTTPVRSAHHRAGRREVDAAAGARPRRRAQPLLRARALARRHQPADAVAAAARARGGRHRRAPHLSRGPAARRVLADAEGDRPAADHRLHAAVRAPLALRGGLAGARAERLAAAVASRSRTRCKPRCAGRIGARARTNRAPCNRAQLHATLHAFATDAARDARGGGRGRRRGRRSRSSRRARTARGPASTATAADGELHRAPLGALDARCRRPPPRRRRSTGSAASATTSTPTRRSAAPTRAGRAGRPALLHPPRASTAARASSSSTPERFEPAYRELHRGDRRAGGSELVVLALLRGIGCESPEIELAEGTLLVPLARLEVLPPDPLARARAARRRSRAASPAPARGRARGGARPPARPADRAAPLRAGDRARAARVDPRPAGRLAGAADPGRRPRRRRAAR